MKINDKEICEIYKHIVYETKDLGKLINILNYTNNFNTKDVKTNIHKLRRLLWILESNLNKMEENVDNV